MKQSGEYRIPAERGLVWRALNDPETLRRCIRGCRSMKERPDGGFVAVVKAKVGPVNAAFNATLELSDVNPPNSYTLNIAVKGGAAGFAKGAVEVVLADEGGATLLRYAATGSVGGKLAQVGSRLVDGAARKLAQDFFGAFHAQMSSRGPDAAAQDATGTALGVGPVGDQPGLDAGQARVTVPDEAIADRGGARPGAGESGDESGVRGGGRWKLWAAIAIVSIIGVVSLSGGL